jgi:hypothetical protein
MNKELKALKEFTAQISEEQNFQQDNSLTLCNFTESLNLELKKNKKKNLILIEKYKSLLIVKNKSNRKPSEIFESLRKENVQFYNIKRVIPLDLIIKVGRRKVSESESKGECLVEDQEECVVENESQGECKDQGESESQGECLVEDSSCNLPTSIASSIEDKILLANLSGNLELTLKNYLKDHPVTGSFKIQFEGRLCSENLKGELFKILIPLINCKVDLTNPEFTILIQAFKNLIGITVIKTDKKNFNFSIY